MRADSKPLQHIVAVAVLLSAASTSVASPNVVPTALNPGDQYRLAFVTSGTRDATSSDIGVYNTFVSDAAALVPELAALSTEWTAIASTPNSDAINNTATTGTGDPIFLLNDTKLVDDYLDLWDGSVDTPFNVDESANVIGPTDVWTGTIDDGTGLGTNTLGPTAGNFAVVGRTQGIGSSWIALRTRVVTEDLPLYALSSLLTTPAAEAVPEPSTLLMLLLGALGVVLRRRRRAAPV